MGRTKNERHDKDTMQLTRDAMNHFTVHKPEIVELQGLEYYDGVVTMFDALLDKLDALEANPKPKDQVIMVNAIPNENSF